MGLEAFLFLIGMALMLVGLWRFERDVLGGLGGFVLSFLGLAVLIAGLAVMMYSDSPTLFWVMCGVAAILCVRFYLWLRREDRREAAFVQACPAFAQPPFGRVLSNHEFELERELHLAEVDGRFYIGIRYEERDHDNSPDWRRTEWGESFPTRDAAGKELAKRLYREFMGCAMTKAELAELDWRAVLNHAAFASANLEARRYLRVYPVFDGKPVKVVHDNLGRRRELFLREADGRFLIGIRYAAEAGDDSAPLHETRWHERFRSFARAERELKLRLKRDFLLAAPKVTPWQAF